MLRIKNIETGYGKKQVLFGVSLEVHPGEIVALIGPNGAGKSTLLKCIMGLIPIFNGDKYFQGSSMNNLSTTQIVRNGISYLPQGKRVFSSLSVMENLELGGFLLPKAEVKSRIVQLMHLFPVIESRKKLRASILSGGEAQMLSIARSLMLQPKLLLLDEPSLGLHPEATLRVLNKITQVNKDAGTSILIIEQKVRSILSRCNRVYSLKLGKVAYEGTPDKLLEDDNLIKELFL